MVYVKGVYIEFRHLLTLFMSRVVIFACLPLCHHQNQFWEKYVLYMVEKCFFFLYILLMQINGL